MIHLTRSARPPLAGRAAAHRRHAGADRGGVRARRLLRVLAVPRAAHAARRSSFAFLLNLNRVAVLLGVYSNLPWIIAPYYAFATMAGARDHRAPAARRISSTSWSRCSSCRCSTANSGVELVDDSEAAAWPYTVGSTARRARCWPLIAYPLALAFVTSRRRIHDIMHHKTCEGWKAEGAAERNLTVSLPSQSDDHCRSFWRKALVTVVAAVGFVVALRSDDARLEVRGAAGDARTTRPALPAPGARLAFSATAYCKGIVDERPASPAQSGIAAADPAAAAGRLGRRDRLAATPRYNGIYTILDTGPAVQGRQVDIYMWSCNEALAVRPAADSPDRAAPGLEPDARRRRASSTGSSSAPGTGAARRRPHAAARSR